MVRLGERSYWRKACQRCGSFGPFANELPSGGLIGNVIEAEIALRIESQNVD
jgi:hypothetical protein